MTRRLVFKHTVEGLFERAYGSQLSSQQRARFLEVGLFGPTVSAEVFGQAFAELRDTVFAGVPHAQAERTMGERFLDGYFDTAMGGLVKVMLRLLSPEKALHRVPQSLMSGANFIAARVEATAPRDFRVVMNDYSTSPEFLCGVVRRMLQLTGTEATVEVLEQRDRAVVLRARWS
jgi:uncharacterized protein (TIGR02265 family)